MEDVARLADALWRAVTYLSVAQLHLDTNPILSEELCAEHVKEHPAGHWGTVPGTAWVLTHLGLAGASMPSGTELMPVLGSGHAGVVQVALAWLTGDLARVRPQFSRDVDGLGRLVRSFPDLDGLGAEVSPLLPGGAYVGGLLGGALAFAQGAAVGAAARVVVPLIGDGECETPTTAASWLAMRELPTDGAVLPVIHVNGFRMGGRSLMGRMSDEELEAYAAGMGWQPRIVHVGDGRYDEHENFHRTLVRAITDARNGCRPALFMRCVKGWSGPSRLDRRDLVGTEPVHKTPLSMARRDRRQFAALAGWLVSYRPSQLFGSNGVPAGELAEVLQIVEQHRCNTAAARALPRVPEPLPPTESDTFATAVTEVLRHHATAGDLRVFCPDELSSNRLGVLTGEPWVTEVLAEEVLLGWLAGWTATGRRGLLVSYEAFAPLLIAGLVQHLKQRRLGASAQPSLNLLLTSYGWHNVYTHGDPSLATALLATGDPAVRVLTPADPERLAATLDRSLRSTGQVNVIIAGKHPAPMHRRDTLDTEQDRGLSIWPHLSDRDEPDLVIVAAGDLAMTWAAAATSEIRRRHRLRVRLVCVQDLTVLGDPGRWPSGLTDTEVTEYLGLDAPVLVVTLGHPAAVWGLLAGRLARPVEVVGWREPPGPMPQDQLAAYLGFDTAGVCDIADRLLARCGAGR